MNGIAMRRLAANMYPDRSIIFANQRLASHTAIYHIRPGGAIQGGLVGELSARRELT